MYIVSDMCVCAWLNVNVVQARAIQRIKRNQSGIGVQKKKNPPDKLDIYIPK